MNWLSFILGLTLLLLTVADAWGQEVVPIPPCAPEGEWICSSDTLVCKCKKLAPDDHPGTISEPEANLPFRACMMQIAGNNWRARWRAHVYYLAARAWSFSVRYSIWRKE
jgi:hypothetical protein